MPDWLKTLTLIVGLSGWLATVIVSLIHGELPNAATLGIPSVLVIAVARSVTIGRKRAAPPKRRRPAPDPDDGADDA